MTNRCNNVASVGHSIEYYDARNNKYIKKNRFNKLLQVMAVFQCFLQRTFVKTFHNETGDV